MDLKYERQMKKGVYEMLVLHLLQEKEKYGYQLISEMKERSGEMFTLKEGTLYPILYRLEEDGCVVSRWSQPKDREVSRKYYAITDIGKQTLAGMTAFWGAFSETINTVLEKRQETEKETEE